MQPIVDPVPLDPPGKMSSTRDTPFTAGDLEQQRPYRRGEPTIELAECLERLLDGRPLTPIRVNLRTGNLGASALGFALGGLRYPGAIRSCSLPRVMSGR